MRAAFLSRLLLWLSPDRSQKGRPDQDIFYHSFRRLLLHDHVVRAQEHRATYQRAIQACLKDEIKDDLVEAYVDDVVVKTKEAHTLVDNLELTFAALNTFQWKLNPKKCIFGVPSGILLGNVVSYDGIRPNPEKVKAVLDMKPPKR